MGYSHWDDDIQSYTLALDSALSNNGDRNQPVFINGLKAYNNIKRWTLRQIQFPYTFNNVFSLNNTFRWNEAAVSLSCTIDEGNYTPTQLITTLATEMTIVSAASGSTQTYTGTFDAITSKMTITKTAGAVVAIGYNFTTSTLSPLIGMRTQADLAPVNDQGFTSTDKATALRTPHLLLKSKELSRLSNSFTHNNVESAVIAVVPLGDALVDSEVRWEPSFPHWNESNQGSLQQVDLYFTDQDNRDIDFIDGSFYVEVEILVQKACCQSCEPHPRKKRKCGENE